MNGARNQFFARSRFAQNQHCGVGGSNHFNMPQYSLQSWTIANHSLKLVLCLLFSSLNVLNGFEPVSIPQILHKSHPAKRYELKHGNDHQHGNSRSILSNKFFFEWCAGSESQAFLMRAGVE